jgi:hypothetical protein
LHLLHALRCRVIFTSGRWRNIADALQREFALGFFFQLCASSAGVMGNLQRFDVELLFEKLRVRALFGTELLLAFGNPIFAPAITFDFIVVEIVLRIGGCATYGGGED